jgi:hypothetical protein
VTNDQSSDAARYEGEQMLQFLIAQTQLTYPDFEEVEHARTRLVAALIEMNEDPRCGEIRGESAVILDRLAEMLEDPTLAIVW